MKKKIMNWLCAENKQVSKVIENHTTNGAIVSAFASVLLVCGAFALANSAAEEESRILQSVMLVIGGMFAAPLISDIYAEPK